MAGHSKWANIKHRKGAQDAKKAKIFAKLSKEIIVAASHGGGDPSSNSSLRLVLAKARAASMPKKNIEAAVAKATGSGGGENFKEYEFAGNINGVSFLIICLADSFNRVTSQIQAYFNKVGGQVVGAQSIKRIFERKGLLEVSREFGDEDDVMMKALDAGAMDFEPSDESYLIYTDPSDINKVREALESQGISEFRTAQVSYFPNEEKLVDKDKAEKILNFIDRVEDDDDVQEVFHNLDASSLEG